MKKIKVVLAISLAIIIAMSLSACGGPYSQYSAAYNKTSQNKSMNAQFSLKLTVDGEDTNSTGNFKMNSAGDIYYEMKLNGKDIVQYKDKDTIHTLVDGNDSSFNINDKKDNKKYDVDNEGKGNEKDNNSNFDQNKFLDEFSGMLEIGKIKELGILDPIPNKYIRSIKSTEYNGGNKYEMTFPDEFLEKLLNTIVAEQSSGSSPLSFSSFKDFSYLVTENADGFMDGMEYKGYTTVTVPGKLMTDGNEKNFDLYIDLIVNIVDPGSDVTFTLPN